MENELENQKEEPTEKSSKAPRKRNYFWVLIIILILAGGGGVYAAYDGNLPFNIPGTSPTAAPTTSPTPEPYAGWKTYTNDKLSFSFKYPPTWAYTEGDYTNQYWLSQRSFHVKFDPGNLYVDINPWTISASPLAHVFDEYTKLSTENIKIGGVDATKDTWQTTAAGEATAGGKAYGIDIKFQHGSDRFRLYYPYKASEGITPKENIVKIIASWKFSGESTAACPKKVDNSPETSGWKPYTSTKYGFSFFYPPTMTLAVKCSANQSCLTTSEGGDVTSLESDSGGIPTLVEIRHHTTVHYNPPAGTNLLTWIPEKFPMFKDAMPASLNATLKLCDGTTIKGVDVKLSGSMQANSQRDIFYIHDNKLFRIMFLDIDPASHVEYYNNWLSGFYVH